MPTVGIKTSLHEVRHAVIMELLGRDVQFIKVLERYNGCTGSRMVRKPSKIKNLFIEIAPYVKRLQQFDWEHFNQEYGVLSDIHVAQPMIDKAKATGCWDQIIRELDGILTLNQPLIDEAVTYLDRNGKGNPETIDRVKWLEMIHNHPLQGQDKLQNLYNTVKPIIYAETINR